MSYNFDIVLDRVGTSSYKYDMRREFFGTDDVIPMWIADMDFPVGPFITDAIKNRAEYDLYGYEFRGPSFFDSARNWVGRRNGWKIENDWMVFTPGVVAALVFSELAFTKEGDGVVIQTPVYHPFGITVREHNRRVLENPLRIVDNRFEIDFEDLDSKLSDARMIILCNPHNPSGRVFTPEELARVGELCIKHDVIIVSDEIHSDMIFTPHKHTHMASLSAEIAARTVTLIAPSKTFNIAGLASAVAVIPDEDLRQKFTEVTSKMHSCEGTTFGNIAFQAAYDHGDQWIDELMEYLKGNDRYIRDFMQENIPNARPLVMEGTYLMWIDFREWGLSGDKLKTFLIDKARLGLHDGRVFGKEGCGFARMNIGTSRAVIRQAMDQLREAAKAAGYC